MDTHTNPPEMEARQVVRGVLSLEGIEQIDPNLGIKIGLFRDCYPLVTEIFYVKENQRKLKYELAFAQEGQQPKGVRLLVVPADVPDDQVSAVANLQHYIAAAEFDNEVATVNVSLSPELYLSWLRLCRTYTVRGRVVCRRIIWDRHHHPKICISPVRGATVTALDVDKILWFCHKEVVGSAVTDVNGFFEITFRFCCWWWPWPPHLWELDLDLAGRIRELLERAPLPGPIPRPEPELDFAILSQLAESLTPAPTTFSLTETLPESPDNLQEIGQAIAKQLPSAELHRLHVWPWYPYFDCRPDIIFRVTQDCGEGEVVIYSEDCDDARMDIGTVLGGVTLVANEKACCAPCCDDPPDGDCLVFYGVGCRTIYPITSIEQDPTSPLAGYARPGTEDRPFGRSIDLRGSFGSSSNADYYKFQYRRVEPSPTGWIDMPADQMGTFKRSYWTGAGTPPYQMETVKPELMDPTDLTIGFYKTIHRYREENPGLPTVVPPSNADMLGIWRTAHLTSSTETPLLKDGLYELQVIGYEYDETTEQLTNEQILTLCPGEETDPNEASSMLLRIDNRTATWSIGSVHIDTSEPDCDYRNICAVIKNEGLPDEACINACSIVRLSAGDTLTIHFEASDLFDPVHPLHRGGHLSHYGLEAHWAESEKFNVLSVGALAPDPTELVGPTYANTFIDTAAHPQATYRASLPASNPEHDRPFWQGGNYKVTVTVGAPVPGTSHSVFETCCAYLLRLDVWKRTTSGCGIIHRNRCEFSFTVLREDLADDPNCPDE